MSPDKVIEVTIGLWDQECLDGTYPTRLAAAIIDALAAHGWHIVPGASSLGPSVGCLVALCPFPPDDDSAYCGSHNAYPPAS